MQSTLNEPSTRRLGTTLAAAGRGDGALGETDRDALVLRFFENKTAQEVGAALGMNEEARRKSA